MEAVSIKPGDLIRYIGTTGHGQLGLVIRKVLLGKDTYEVFWIKDGNCEHYVGYSVSDLIEFVS